jgi:hypothetical protein
MDSNGGKTARPFTEGGRHRNQFGRQLFGWDSGARRLPPVCPVTPGLSDRSNGEDMDALIKSLRPASLLK